MKDKHLDIYIVTRMTEDKSSVPNLGVFLDKKAAFRHFHNIVEDRKGKNRNYKCKVHWIIDPVLRVDDTQGCIKEAYIEHPKTKYQKKYIENLRVEWWGKTVKEMFLDKLIGM